jgi:hypothetical protein
VEKFNGLTAVFGKNSAAKVIITGRLILGMGKSHVQVTENACWRLLYLTVGVFFCNHLFFTEAGHEWKGPAAVSFLNE